MKKIYSVMALVLCGAMLMLSACTKTSDDEKQADKDKTTASEKDKKSDKNSSKVDSVESNSKGKDKKSSSDKENKSDIQRVFTRVSDETGLKETIIIDYREDGNVQIQFIDDNNTFAVFKAGNLGGVVNIVEYTFSEGAEMGEPNVRGKVSFVADENTAKLTYYSETSSNTLTYNRE